MEWEDSRYDFKIFGQAIKSARRASGQSRREVGEEMNISSRYLANIENKGQPPSLQIFYELVTRFNISVDQFFFPDKNEGKSTQRRQLEELLDLLDDKGLKILAATAKGILDADKRPEDD
jgi:transcriptional regulator with XRE-family HTH domain